MAGEQNFFDFMLKILNGIEYGTIPTTNRAYQWIKQNSYSDGECLKQLKNIISTENFVTISEMNEYKRIAESADNIQKSEKELDEELMEFFTDDADAKFDTEEFQLLEKMLLSATTCSNELTDLETFYKHRSSKLDGEIKRLRTKQSYQKEDKNQAISMITKAVEQFQAACELEKDEMKNTKQLLENIHEEELLFKFDFKGLKVTSELFRDYVIKCTEKFFGKTREESMGIDGKNYAVRGNQPIEEEKQEVETFIRLIDSIAEETYRQVMLKITEQEYALLVQYINDLVRDSRGKTFLHSDLVRMSMQTALHMQMENAIADEISKSEHVLKEYYKTSVMNDEFRKEEWRLQQILDFKTNKMTGLTQLSCRFQNLIGILAVLLERSADYVETTIEYYNENATKLDNLRDLFRDRLKHLETLARDQKIITEDALILFGKNVLKTKEITTQSDLLRESRKRISNVLNDLCSVTDTSFDSMQLIENRLMDVDRVIYSGPAKQPYYTSIVHNPKTQIEKRYIQFSKLLHDFQINYNVEMEKLSNSNEKERLLRILWIKFLVDPVWVKEEYKKLKSIVNINKTDTYSSKNPLTLLTNRSSRT